MANTPRGSKPDPMSREVDRLLAQLGDARLRSIAGFRPSRDGATASRPTFRSRARAGARPKAGPGRYDRLALWARIILASALGAVITQWPYAHACGWPLLGYLGAVGDRDAHGRMDRRHFLETTRCLVHALSFILVFWGIVLAAEQVLPRIGYAAVASTWRCGAGPWLPFMGM